MPKVKNPVQFSTCFGIEPTTLARARIFDPTLNVDTKLFVDPLLLEGSSHPEVAEAKKTFEGYFEGLIKLLSVSSRKGDIAWKEALKRLQFSEIKGTCLGYGAGSIRGHAIGPKLARRLARTAKEIVDLGVRDPDLFLLLPFLEENVGPDLISDVTTRIILPNLASLNGRIATSLKLPTEEFLIGNCRGHFAVNPVEAGRTPIILVPTDILRNLPVAYDWEGVCDAAAENEILRKEVNQLIGDIWKKKTRKDKGAIRASALSEKKAFDKLLEMLHGAEAVPYEIEDDPDGLLLWRRIHETISTEYPLALRKPSRHTVDEVYEVVKAIVDHFRFLIEKRDLSRELWYAGKRRDEKSVQRIFFAVADSYCKANDVDITPEADTGTGAIDFKFSSGYEARVLLEVKLSDNKKLVPGYQKQLEAYKEAERAFNAVYLVIDVGGMGDKDDKLIQMKNAAIASGNPASDIEFIDGSVKPSASKR